MPILKTEILGTEIEINFEDGQKEKLLTAIERFNQRIKEFSHLEGKVSNNKLILLAALKAEDNIYDIINQSPTLENLSKEIISLKDKIRALTLENQELQNIQQDAFNEIDKIEKYLDKSISKIKDKNFDEDK